MDESCEIIFVNDGSPDNSIVKLINLSEKDSRVKIIDLSRNFGHHSAIIAGLENSIGQHVYLTDVDLEEPPEKLIDFYECITNKKNKNSIDVIYGIQSSRNNSGLAKYGGKFFYNFFKYMSNVSIDDNVMTMRIMTRRYVDALLLHKEKELYLAGLFSITGFKQKAITVEKFSRRETSYTVTKRVNLFIQAIVSFSSVPLVIFFYLGGTISFLTFLYSFFLVIRVLLSSYVLEGWTSLIVSIWFLSGIILMAIGVIGIYLSKIFNEVKNRPVYIVRKIYERK
ncbi:glycosyltransferase family 2 protein [Vibrio diazotrophicus]